MIFLSYCQSFLNAAMVVNKQSQRGQGTFFNHRPQLNFLFASLRIGIT